jgi:TolB-like protein/Tfp pilus assembly protein PilF
MSSLDRIRQRNAQWGLAYLAAVWVLLQVLAFIAQSFGWSPRVARVATVIAMAGLVVTLVLAWYHGERGRQRASLAEIVILGVIILAGGGAAWALRGDPAPAVITTTTAPATEQNSIAVLPFVDMSASRDQEYFSDGVAEEILNGLAKIPGLRVAARTSSFSFKDKNVPVDEVGKRLRVANVLEGSVRRSGDKVRITAQLIDVSNGYRVWSETFDRELKDIFVVQDEISRAIAGRLSVRFASAHTESNVTTNQNAYDAYLRGRYFFAKRTPDGLRRAEQFFQTASTLDPNFAPAHSGLAATLLVLPLYDDVDVKEVRPRARNAVLRALQLDSTLADGWAGLAYIRMSYDHDWQGAAEAFNRALERNPNDANTYTWYGDFLSGQGLVAQSIAQYERAVQLDALSALRHLSLGWMLMANRRFNDSERELTLATELDPNLVDGHTHLARLRLFQGQHETAIKGLEDSVEKSQRRANELGYLGHAYATAGRRDDAVRILNELEARRASGTATPLSIAFVQIGLGDHDKAFKAIEQARKDGDMWLTENNVDLIFDPLRADPRWERLRGRMGLGAVTAR